MALFEVLDFDHNGVALKSFLLIILKNYSKKGIYGKIESLVKFKGKLLALKLFRISIKIKYIYANEILLEISQYKLFIWWLKIY